MGRTKRFSILNTAIKKYGATGGEAITKFKAFKAGTTVITFTGTASGTRELRTILPFGLDSTDPKLLIKVSGRAIAAASLTAAGLAEADLNLAAADANADIDRGFVPAKAIIKSGATGTATNTPSKITGKNYKKYGGSTATFPFGQGTGDAKNNLLAVQAGIAIKVAAGSAKRSVTFTPERFYQ